MPSLSLVKSVFVWMFGLHFVNKLHLGSSLRSPSVDFHYNNVCVAVKYNYKAFSYDMQLNPLTGIYLY